MRAVAFGLWLGFVVIFSLTARADTSPDVQALIGQQLDAFAHDDAPGAFAFAAPDIQRIFPDADAFMTMVKSAYPPVYRHRSVQFGKQSRDGDAIKQGVIFIDADNVVWGGVYTLALQGDGSWKITGCVLVRSADTSL